jgi:hypothetical protein
MEGLCYHLGRIQGKISREATSSKERAGYRGKAADLRRKIDVIVERYNKIRCEGQQERVALTTLMVEELDHPWQYHGLDTGSGTHTIMYCTAKYVLTVCAVLHYVLQCPLLCVWCTELCFVCCELCAMYCTVHCALHCILCTVHFTVLL